jgi:hypothetical protein
MTGPRIQRAAYCMQLHIYDGRLFLRAASFPSDIAKLWLTKLLGGVSLQLRGQRSALRGLAVIASTMNRHSDAPTVQIVSQANGTSRRSNAALCGASVGHSQLYLSAFLSSSIK